MYDYELFLEDEERAKRNLEEFKKKYNYDPKTKTIEYIKGRRIPFTTDCQGSYVITPANRSFRKHVGHDDKDGEDIHVALAPSEFETADGLEYAANHEFGHLVDDINNRMDNKDHSSLVHKYDSGTDLSKLPKDIRRERLKVKKQERDLKKEKNPVKKVIKNDKYVRDRDKVLNKLENHVKSTNDETAKAILQHRKDTRNAKRQAVKNALVTSDHNKKYTEVLADAYSLRNANDKNIKKNIKSMKKNLGSDLKHDAKWLYNYNRNQMVNDVWKPNKDKFPYSDPKGRAVLNTLVTVGSDIENLKDFKKILKRGVSQQFRAQNAKKVANKMQESVYNMIIEALQEQIDDGEITLEFAEAVNDLAYEKYMM